MRKEVYRYWKTNLATAFGLFFLGACTPITSGRVVEKRHEPARIYRKFTLPPPMGLVTRDSPDRYFLYVENCQEKILGICKQSEIKVSKTNYTTIDIGDNITISD